MQPRRALEQTTGLGEPQPTPIASPSPKLLRKLSGQGTGLQESNLRTLDYLRFEWPAQKPLGRSGCNSLILRDRNSRISTAQNQMNLLKKSARRRFYLGS